MFTAKMKIILVIFGIIVVLFALQSIFGMVSTEKKRERFENDESSKNDNDDKKESDALKERKASVNNIKLSILESVEDVFEKHYPKAYDQKPLVFDMLLNKEAFEDIKDKHEDGKNITDVVYDYVKKHMQGIAEMKKDEAFKIEDYYQDAAKDKLKKVEEQEVTVTRKDESNDAKEKFEEKSATLDYS